MVPRSSYPPIHHHPSLTQTLAPSAFEQHLTNFLTRTQSQPYLHPDSYLSTAGIRFSAHSGPDGGLALHHLRRICKGLKGESLVQESEEELAKFYSIGEDEELPASNDSKLDALISEKERTVAQDGTTRKTSKKRKRQKDVEAWAEESSSQAEAPFTSLPYQELESFATTPMHVSSFEEGHNEGGHREGGEGWQDLASFEQQQKPWFNDVDPVERAGAPVVKQGGGVPKVRESGEAEKKVKREEKRARKKEMRKEIDEKQKKKKKYKDKE